ncbi:hypothetical protein [Phocaeicola vulgatus]|jgi:hypothetical protein|nr:hypothetical protein [Phocaeicola vulgatus]
MKTADNQSLSAVFHFIHLQIEAEYRILLDGKATQLCPFWPRRIIPFG